MKIAGTLPCSFVNGEGARYVVFTQGCLHHCPGCQNPDTWDLRAGSEVSAERLAEDILRHKHIDGITLSGGDPYYQEAECVKLLKLLPGMNVWVYTGYDYDMIKDSPLTQLVDVVVDGPFMEELKCEGQMYGSSNQKIIRREKNA